MTDTPGHDTGSRRPSALAMVLIAALLLTFVVSIWAMLVRLDRASYVSALMDHSKTFVESEATTKDDHVRGAIVADLLTMLATAAVFITWFAIVVRRLHRARPADFRHGPGWAIGGWFVPVLSLVYPKQMADDAWRAATGRSRSVPAVFHFWWAAWLLSNLAGLVALGFSGNELSSLMNRDRVGATGEGIAAIAALLAIAVVAKLDVASHGVQPMPGAGWPGAGWPGAAMAPGSPWPAQQPMAPAPQAPQVAQQPVAQQPQHAFNPPPGWPTPPPGWVPPPGWQPDPAWPPAPVNWPFWIPVNPA